ncbi:hypothetical protein CHS0354_024034 [Potamilus streckersoni]|uniref:UvrABC system protein B n=1 Tax=Potamilus streckersoni TaxID=2493646 RepID=A0AAE0RZ99_9BIVA|nr:hypothetical protein CHS0354_024034 [Potamilus streckersoni]
MFLSNGCTAFSIEYGLDKVLINSNQVGFDSEYEVIGFSPEIQIDFFNRLFRDSINSRTVQLFKNTDELRTSIPLTFYFDKNDQSAVVRLSSHLAELESETSYTLNLLKNISFADGIKLGQDYAVKFKTSILNNAASVRLTFNGEDIFENNAVFSVTIKNTDDISKVPLTIKVSKGSELKVENQIMALSDNVYVGTLDFTASLTKKITVTSEDLKLSKDYEIKLVISNVNAEKKFISEFKITRTLNPLLSMDYMATIDEASQIITLKLPAKTNLTKLVPSITFVGSGKTFTISNVIKEVNKPTLVISHNKTLAAQLYGELKEIFPSNAVEYFISYYDFYQPEAYLPSMDKFIDKDFRINDEIDRLRLKSTSSLLSGRRDVIVVASVSCIYGLASPEEWAAEIATYKVGDSKTRKGLIQELVGMHYLRVDTSLSRARFRVHGDVIDIVPSYEEMGFRIQLSRNKIEKIYILEPKLGRRLGEVPALTLFPAKQFVTSDENLKRSIQDIEKELIWRLGILRNEGKFIEAGRLEERTKHDLEMMRELGYCSGIENYSRHIGNRKSGERPYCLFDYFPKNDFLVVIDESHVSLPQIRAMYAGDRMRKTILIEHGFRLPSALDNRPLTFNEFESLLPNTIFVSATPSDYELEKCSGVIVEQIIRPTGLLDPNVEVRTSKNQIDNLIVEIKKRTRLKEKILVMTLTKKMSEDLKAYLEKMGIRAEYLHSEIKSLQRVQILRDLRTGVFDVLVGVNLLREGLDLPEVSLVAIMDADKEGFLRDKKSLFQISGRAARNINGTVILYADKITSSIQALLNETQRRRKIQNEFNQKNNISPTSIIKTMEQTINSTGLADMQQKEERRIAHIANLPSAEEILNGVFESFSIAEKKELLADLEKEMTLASEKMEYEKAAILRDEIARLKTEL